VKHFIGVGCGSQTPSPGITTMRASAIAGAPTLDVVSGLCDPSESPGCFGAGDASRSLPYPPRQPDPLSTLLVINNTHNGTNVIVWVLRWGEALVRPRRDSDVPIL